MRYLDGQALIETVVAVGIMALLTTGLLVSTTYALRTGQDGRTRSMAAKYAQEGMELSRKLRDVGWTVFQNTYGGLAPGGNTWCLPKDGVWAAGACSSGQWLDGVYNRSVVFTWDSTSSRMDTVVTVAWTDAKGVRATQVRSFLTQWR